MRYTTIIDITGMASWRNINARLIYLFLVLKCGYHDEDRDIIIVSIRSLCYHLNMSLSTVRYALHLLASDGLITYLGESKWSIKKWEPRKEISKRKTPKEVEIQRAKELQDEEKQRAKEQRAKEKAAMGGKSSWELRIDNLKKKAAEGDKEANRQLEKVLGQLRDIERKKKADDWRRLHHESNRYHDPAVENAMKEELKKHKL